MATQRVFDSDVVMQDPPFSPRKAAREVRFASDMSDLVTRFESFYIVDWPKVDWQPRVWSNYDDCSIPKHVYYWTHQREKPLFLRGRVVTQNVLDRIFMRDCGKVFRRQLSGPKAHVFGSLDLLAFGFVTGLITGGYVMNKLTEKGVMGFLHACLAMIGRSLSKRVDDFYEKLEVTTEKVLDSFKHILKIVEVASLAFCFSNLAPLCETTLQWASLLGLVLIPAYGQTLATKFMAIFQKGARCNSDAGGDKVEPFVTVLFTLLSTLFTGSVSSSLVTNFFRMADLTGCKDLFKKGSKSAITKLTELIIGFLRYLAAYRSNGTIDKILQRFDLAEQARTTIKDVPNLLIRLDEVYATCNQMAARPELYEKLSEYQDFLAHCNGVLRILASVPEYPHINRVYFSQRYLKAYEAVVTAVHKRNTLSRVEPTVLYIAGPPGICKTSIAEEIAKRVAKNLWPKEFEEGSYKYDRNSLLKHWDNYTNQPICKCEEAFNNPNRKQDKVCEEDTTWLGLISPSVFPLSMASIPEKGTRFTSELVICTSNTAYPESGTVDRAALLRRMHLHCLFCWKPGFPNFDVAGTNGTYIPTGARTDRSHLQMYLHRPDHMLMKPSGTAVKNLPVDRIYPHSTDEMARWEMEFVGENGEKRKARGEYQETDIDQLVQHCIANIRLRRAIASRSVVEDGARAHVAEVECVPLPPLEGDEPLYGCAVHDRGDPLCKLNLEVPWEEDPDFEWFDVPGIGRVPLVSLSGKKYAKNVSPQAQHYIDKVVAVQEQNKERVVLPEIILDTGKSFFRHVFDMVFPVRLEKPVPAQRDCLRGTYSSKGLDGIQIHEIKSLDELVHFEVNYLRTLKNYEFGTTRKIFDKWYHNKVSLSFDPNISTDEELLPAIVSLAASYRCFVYETYTINEKSEGCLEWLTMRGWHIERNGENQDGSINGFAEGPTRTGTRIRLPLANLPLFIDHIYTDEYEKLLELAKESKIRVQSTLETIVRAFCWTFMVTFVLLTVCQIVVSMIVAIFSSIIEFLRGLRAPKAEACSLDEIQHMIDSIQRQGLEKRSSEEGHSYYDKHGKRMKYSVSRREYVVDQEYEDSKRKTTRSSRRRKLAKSHALDWEDDIDWNDLVCEERNEDHDCGNPTDTCQFDVPPMETDILLDRFAKQMVRVTYYSNSGRTLTMYGIQITGRTVMIPSHLLATEVCDYYSFGVDTDTISFKETVPKKNIRSFQTAKGVAQFNLAKSDGMLITFQNLPVQRSLIGHLARNLLDVGYFRKPKGLALIPRIGQWKGNPRVTIAAPCGNIESVGQLTYSDNQYREYTAELYKTVIPELVSGDCGSLLLVKEDGQSRIAGIYVAGSENGKHTYFQPVTRGLIESMTSDVKCHGFDSYPPIVDKEEECSHSTKIVNDCVSIGIYEHWDKPGVMSIPPSEIRPSPIQLENATLFDHPVTTKPAVLNKVALQKAVNKKWCEPGYFDPAFLDVAIDWVKQDLAAHINTCFQLGIQDSIDGETNAYGQASRMAMDTSPGLPWSWQKPSGSAGKTAYFDFVDGHYVPKQEVVDAVQDICDARDLGLIKPALFRGTLKDERRDIERVLEAKTRIFTAGPMEKVIADRMLFLTFIKQFKDARLKLQHAYGINPEGLEWNEMIHQHINMGSHHFGFDYSGFDASESLVLLDSVSKCIASCYYPYDARRIECSGIESFNHFVVIDGVVYKYHQGNPSGCTMTTIYNTIANWLLLYYAWIKLAGENGRPVTRDFYRQNCIAHAYGDDFICTVSKDCVWFNGETIPPILSVCGIKATAPDKTSCQKFYPLDQLTFLRRHFVPNPFGGSKALYAAPLPKELIEEIPMWFFKGADDNDFQSNIRTSIYSAAFWGRAYFEWYVARIRSTEYGKHFLNTLDTTAIFQQASAPFVGGHESTRRVDRVFVSSKGHFAPLSSRCQQTVKFREFDFPSVVAAFGFAKCMFHGMEDPSRFQRLKPQNAYVERKKIVSNSNWKRMRREIMKEILLSLAKTPKWSQLLLETTDSVLFEASNDTTWGIGLPQSVDPRMSQAFPGENLYGGVLMDVRTHLTLNKTV